MLQNPTVIYENSSTIPPSWTVSNKKPSISPTQKRFTSESIIKRTVSGRVSKFYLPNEAPIFIDVKNRVKEFYKALNSWLPLTGIQKNIKNNKYAFKSFNLQMNWSPFKFLYITDKRPKSFRGKGQKIE